MERRQEPRPLNRPVDDELSLESVAFVEALAEQFHTAPEALPDGWRKYFEAQASSATNGRAKAPSFRPAGLFAGRDAAAATPLPVRVAELVRAYRGWGHMAALLNPFDMEPIALEDLEPAAFGLSDADLARPAPPNAVAEPEPGTVDPLNAGIQPKSRRHSSVSLSKSSVVIPGFTS
jgi:2-oxoglutarate dehydrogenase complex dehydrogenase (E1) component-like enzyme